VTPTVSIKMRGSEYRVVKGILFEHLRKMLAAAQYGECDQPSVRTLGVQVDKIVAAQKALARARRGWSFTMVMRDSP
jgi:hypothetical protein